MELLRLAGGQVVLGGRILLEGLDLSLASGERVALRGPSGCGKTTLLRALCGLIDLGAGRLTLRGKAPADLGWPAWRRGVSYLAQAPVMLRGSVRENLARPFAYAGTPGAFEEGAARGLLQRLLLAPALLDQEARTLSGGEQQRVALARTLLIAPEVLLLDEPTSALDEAAAAALEALVDERCEAGAAALIVTHDAARAGRWCQRSLELPLNPGQEEQRA